MQRRTVISVDVMGGSGAPASVFDGLSMFRKKRPDVSFLLCGKQKVIEQYLGSHPDLVTVSKIRHCDGVVSDDEQPVRAMKNSAGTSMRSAIEAVQSEEADCCISCGNTGALMVISKMLLGMLDGIKRPAIVSVFPNRKSGSVILDLGANTVCSPQELFEFAVMGDSFCRVMFKKDNPTIGILNVGVEEYKGRDAERKAADLIREGGLNFHGFVEGHDLCDGTVDVVVTDGFTGNVALKVAEGVAKMSLEMIKAGFSSTWMSKLGAMLAAKALRKSLDSMDPRRFNGAMFVGIDGVVIKSHGSSDPLAFSCALNVAAAMVEDGINRDIMLMMQQQHSVSDFGSTLVSKIKKSLGID